MVLHKTELGGLVLNIRESLGLTETIDMKDRVAKRGFPMEFYLL